MDQVILEAIEHIPPIGARKGSLIIIQPGETEFRVLVSHVVPVERHCALMASLPLTRLVSSSLPLDASRLPSLLYDELCRKAPRPSHLRLMG